MGQITMSDLMAQETKRDPIAFYAHLHEQGPLTYLANFSEIGGAWIATSYDDALTILKDPRFIKDRQKLSAPQQGQGSPAQGTFVQRTFAWRRDVLMVDPPDHTRLRSLVSKVFTPRMIELLRPRIQQITDELLDAVQDQGKMDLITEFAYLLPITVISEMLGIPVKDRAQFRVWTQALINLPETIQPGVEDARIVAVEEFLGYIKTLLAEKREHPANDLISGLVQAEDEGDKLNEQEVISTVFILIVAGHETTVNLIGNGTLALLQHPDQLHLLQNDLSLIPSAVEELLRYTAPVTLATPRWASEDVTLHDQVIRKGDMVFVSLIGADTDAQHFADPASLDLTREENQHLAFGKGIHFCLGAPLARLEGQIAFSTLLRRLPHLQLAVEPEHLTWTRTPILRGLKSLPVTF